MHSGMARSAKHVIGAKYGKDAGDAGYNLFEGARVIYKLPGIPLKEAKKALKESTK